MNNDIFKNQFSGLMDPEIDKEFPLEEEDKKFIIAYNEGYEKLSEENRLFTFRNVIRNSGRCGFASGGSKQYLVNTDSRNRYRVTVRTYWRSGINNGQSDRSHTMEAGGRKYLGCTDSGRIPVTYYRRQVVGEVKI